MRKLLLKLFGVRHRGDAPQKSPKQFANEVRKRRKKKKLFRNRKYK